MFTRASARGTIGTAERGITLDGAYYTPETLMADIAEEEIEQDIKVMNVTDLTQGLLNEGITLTAGFKRKSVMQRLLQTKRAIATKQMGDNVSRKKPRLGQALDAVINRQQKASAFSESVDLLRKHDYLECLKLEQVHRSAVDVNDYLVLATGDQAELESLVVYRLADIEEEGDESFSYEMHAVGWTTPTNEPLTAVKSICTRSDPITRVSAATLRLLDQLVDQGVFQWKSARVRNAIKISDECQY